jgi:UDP-N-acetylmuramoylalanine-D-glutamate ligase
VLTLPDSGARIHAELDAALAGSRPDSPSAVAGVVDCADLDTAVARGFGWARPGGVVLLSPAAPSFGHFRDYRDRGEAFARAAASCR